MNPLEIDNIGTKFKFSICTIVTNPEMYRSMGTTFEAAGFTTDTEYLYIDNTVRNKYDAYRGINRFLSLASGKYIIICHQDIEVIDNKSKLEACIATVDALDDNWAILGNAGSSAIKNFSRHYLNGDNELENAGTFPSKVYSLDENFLVIKKEVNLGLSADLEGFHFYGTDICLLCDIRGFSCYVIDFVVKHLSFGHTDTSFYAQKELFIKKYSLALKSRFIQTTCTKFYVSSSEFKTRLLNLRFSMFLVKEYFKRFKL